MKIEAHIQHSTIARLLRELAPVRIHMAPPEEGTRWLELQEPTLIQPIPGRGLRIKAPGRFRFDLMKVPLRVSIRQISLVLEPVVITDDGPPRLAFAIELEEGDLVGVPGALERPLVKRVNHALSPKATKMVWAFGDTLTKRFELPERLEPLDALSLEATAGAITVDHEATHFAIQLTPQLERHELLEPENEPDFAPPAESIDPRLLLGTS